MWKGCCRFDGVAIILKDVFGGFGDLGGVCAGGGGRGCFVVASGVWKVVLESFVGGWSALRGCWVRLVGGVGNGSLSSHYRMYGHG